MPATSHIIALLLAVNFTLATWLQPRLAPPAKPGSASASLLTATMGDARRMFANHFFVKADVYFHSGYYPSIFDQAHTNETHIAEQASKDSNAPEEKEEEEDFLGKPRDWVEKFGRNFYITRHTHLQSGGEKEILPWLKLAAELDPQQVEIYVVTSYWLREHLHQPQTAEEFLRDGLRANPASHEILFELGRLYRDDYNNPSRARNLWELADRQLTAHEKRTGEPDIAAHRQILVNLARLEENTGQFAAAIGYLERLRDALISGQEHQKETLDAQIAELKNKIAAAAH